MKQKGIFMMLAFGVTSVLLTGCWGKKDHSAAIKVEEKSESEEDKKEEEQQPQVGSQEDKKEEEQQPQVGSQEDKKEE